MAETRAERRERRKGRSQPSTSSEKNLSLGSVPFFQRPMESSKEDQFVGRDEAGNNIYRTLTGRTYTVSPNPDQRTTRTKVEEALEAFYDDPKLPTKDQIVEGAKGVAQGAWESFESAVEGTGTYGDVFGLAGGSAAPAYLAKAPEGSISLFIGRKASDPTRNASGESHPISTGKDSMVRFEIDDSQAQIINTPARISGEQLSNWKNPDLDFFDVKPFTTLDEVLDHEELYRQYPQMSNFKIVVDEDLSGTNTMGYYDSTDGIIAIRENIAEDPKLFKSVLLHEIQHLVQNTEGFDSGTNTSAAMVTPEYKDVKAELEASSQKSLEEAKKVVSEGSFASSLEPLKEEIQKIADHLGADLSEDRPRYGTPAYSLQFAYNRFDRTLSSLKGLDVNDPDFNRKYISLRNDLSYELAAAIDTVSQADPKVKERLSGTFPSLSTEATKEKWERLTTLARHPKIQEELTSRGLPDIIGSTFLTSRASGETYRRRSGEVEARNTETRQDLTLEERRGKPPRLTEDRPRSQQWERKPGESLFGFSNGGLATEKGSTMRTKAEQMRFAFMDGGMVDSGVSHESSSGNEIPPGSLKEEVADKVPAQLSEGEYVLPADVVQYLGLDKIEKLVNKAKEDLKKMEENGRIGGEPIPESSEDKEDDELPLSDEELMGGYAEGGMVAPQSTGVENKTYVGPGGQKRIIMFSNGQPLQAVPPGFVPEGEKAAQQKKEQDMDPMRVDGGGHNSNDTPSAKALSSWGEEDFKGYREQAPAISTVASVLGAVNPMFGAGAKAILGMENKNILSEAKSRLSNAKTPEEKSFYQGFINDVEKDQKDKEGILGGLVGSDGLLGGLIGKDGLLGGRFGKSNEDSGKDKGFLGGLFSGGSKSQSNSPSVSESSSPSSSSSPSQGNSSSPGGGEMAKGGLVKRRKK